MKRLIGILVVFALICVLLLFALSGFVGKGIAAGVERYGPKVTQTDIALGRMDLSLLNGSGELGDLRVGNPDSFSQGSAIKVDRLRLDLRPTSLLSDKIVIQEVLVDKPEITYEVGLGGSNLGQILKNIEAFAGEAEKAAGTRPGKRVQIDRLSVSNGLIRVSGKLTREQEVVVPLPPITLEGIGQGPEGATFGQTLKVVFSALNRETIAAVGSSSKSVTEQLKQIGEQTKSDVGGLLKGLKKAIDGEESE